MGARIVERSVHARITWVLIAVLALIAGVCGG